MQIIWDKLNKKDYGNHNFFKPNIFTEQKCDYAELSEVDKASEWQEEQHAGTQTRQHMNPEERGGHKKHQGGRETHVDHAEAGTKSGKKESKTWTVFKEDVCEW